MNITKRMNEMLNDPGAMFEAMSIDGITYPFPTNFLAVGEDNWPALRDKINAFDDERAICIGNLIKQHETGTIEERIACDAAIGSIIRKQVLGHLARIEEA